MDMKRLIAMVETGYTQSKSIEAYVKGQKTTISGFIISECDWDELGDEAISPDWAVNRSTAFRANRIGMVVQLKSMYDNTPYQGTVYRVASKEVHEKEEQLDSEVILEFEPLSGSVATIFSKAVEKKPLTNELKFREDDVKLVCSPLSDLHLASIFESQENVLPRVL
jgi:hypothetical protein